MGKGIFEAYADSIQISQGSHALRSRILFYVAVLYRSTLYVDSEGPDRAARVRRLFRAFAVPTYSKDPWSDGADQMWDSIYR